MKTYIGVIALGFAIPAFVLTTTPAVAGDLKAGLGVKADVKTDVDTRGPSASAQLNSNGQFSTDRDFGRARAEERMSAQGLAHSNAPDPKDRKRSLRPVTPRVQAEGSAGAEAILNRR